MDAPRADDVSAIASNLALRSAGSMRVRAFTESVAVVNDILPAGEIVRRLAREAERALAEPLPA